MLLITGGARSGKSNFAENLAGTNKTLYIATAIATDEEMFKRIEIHKKNRPENWVTYEGYYDIFEIISRDGNNFDFILLECITTLITNLMFKFSDNDVDNMDFDFVGEKISNQIEKLITVCKNTSAKTLIITNETGLGIVPDNKLSRNFRDIAGRINQKLAKESDEVYMVISGIPLKLK